ncbi:MAG: hypothetical protein ACRES7_05910 [Gammaproteobacteria bacterium]
MNVQRTIGLKLSLSVLALAAGGFGALAAPANGQTTAAATSPTRSTPALPAALRPALYQTLARDAGSTYRINSDGCAVLPKQQLEGCFDNRGAHFNSKDGEPLALHLLAYGRDAKLVPLAPVSPAIRGNRATYVHGALTEWWRVLPMGFEQSFTITQRPIGDGMLTLALGARGKAGQLNGVLSWGKLRYGGLVVIDASGKIVPATLKSDGDRILIAVNDTHAAYPLTVDPMVWQEQKLIASDGRGYNQFGFSVAVSGATALIGAPAATVSYQSWVGAVYVFTESNGVWSETQKLTPSDTPTMASFGWSVALDGTTAIIGASGLLGSTDAEQGEGAIQGSAYIFTESNGVWSETQKLVASDGIGYDEFGWAVAVSGTTALVSSLPASPTGATASGAVYVFDYSNGTWTQAQKLIASDSAADDGFGNSIAFDGTTALIGAPLADIGDNPNQGAVYVFAKSDGIWTQTQKFAASDGAADDFFGNSIAFSGPTAVIGASYATINGNDHQGAAYVFTESNGSWNEIQKLTASDGTTFDLFGSSVAIDSPNILVGAPRASINGNAVQGAAYAFAESNGVWRQTKKLIAHPGTANSYYGWSVAIPAGSSNALVGASYAPNGGTVGQGAVYFISAPNSPRP